ASQDIQVMAAAPAGMGGIELQRNPKFGRITIARGKCESGRHYADDGALPAIQTDVAAENAPVATKSRLPQPEGEHGIAGRARPVILGIEDSTDQGRH